MLSGSEIQKGRKQGNASGGCGQKEAAEDLKGGPLLSYEKGAGGYHALQVRCGGDPAGEDHIDKKRISI